MSAGNGAPDPNVVKVAMQPDTGRVLVETTLPREVVLCAMADNEPAIVSLAVCSALLMGVEEGEAPEPIKRVASSALGTLDHGMEAVAKALADHERERGA